MNELDPGAPAQPARPVDVHNGMNPVDRRTFLRLAGVSAAGAVATACSPGGTPIPASTTSAAPVTAPPATSGLSTAPPNWDALRSKLAGDLLRPGDADYANDQRAFNTLFDTRKPIAVAKVTSAEDVQACLGATAGRVSLAAR